MLEKVRCRRIQEEDRNLAQVEQKVFEKIWELEIRHLKQAKLSEESPLETLRMRETGRLVRVRGREKLNNFYSVLNRLNHIFGIR